MLRVVAAVIHNPAGEILIARRPLHKHQGGLWEFPGGKIEDGERTEEALVRELREELGITATAFRPLLTVEHHYSDKSVRLEVWRVTAFDGIAHGAEGQPVVWVTPVALTDYAFPAANGPIVKAARLPEMYAISPDPAGVGWELLPWLQARLQPGQWLLLRAKSLSAEAYGELARAVAAYCSAIDATLLLHDRPDLLADIPAAGVQLTAASLAALPHSWRRQDAGIGETHYLGFSTHNEAELAKAWRLGADLATLSPVRATDSHPGQSGMGWERWGCLARAAGLPVYALGGMTPEDRAAAHAAGGQGVAGIRGLLFQH